MTNKNYNIGIIGCGWVGTNRHIPSYALDDRANIVAVYDHKIEKANKTASNFEIENSYDDIDEFLQEDLDLVSICTPPWTHRELGIHALEAGTNVLTEKPMAMSVSGGREMVETADRTGNKLGIVHNFLYSRSMLEARSNVKNNEIGEIKTVIGFQTSSPNRKLPTWYPELPGGLFYDESPHLLYLIEYFLGPLDVDNVSAQYDPEAKQSLNVVDAALRGEDGTLGTLNMIFEAPLSEWHLAVIGTKKILVIDIFRDILLEFDAEESHDATDVVGVSLSAMMQESAGIMRSGVQELRNNLMFGMDRLVTQYLDALENNGEPPVTAEEGYRILETMHEILDSCGISTE